MSVKLIFLLLVYLIPASRASNIETNKNRIQISESILIAENKDSISKIIKTVTASGYGVSIENASQNAAENALAELVASFIDSDTFIKKQKEIIDGVKSKTKPIKKDIKDYSQGSIQYFEILNIKQNGSIYNVTARVDVRVEDFEAYIKKLAFGSNSVSKELATNLFTKALVSPDNLKYKYDLIVENILDPIRKAEVYEIEIGEITSLEDFQTKGKVCINNPNKSYCKNSGGYKDWDRNRTFVFPFTISLENNFKENMINTLNNISDKKIDTYDIKSFAKGYSATDTYRRSYDRSKDYGISIYSPNRKNKTTYILKNVLDYWQKKLNITRLDMSKYYFANPAIKYSSNLSTGSCRNSNNYFNPLLLSFKGENNKTLANYEFSSFACNTDWSYPISIFEPYWIKWADRGGYGESYMPKLSLLASGQYAWNEKAIFLKRDYVIVAELDLEILQNLRGIEIEFLQNN